MTVYWKQYIDTRWKKNQKKCQLWQTHILKVYATRNTTQKNKTLEKSRVFQCRRPESNWIYHIFDTYWIYCVFPRNGLNTSFSTVLFGSNTYIKQTIFLIKNRDMQHEMQHENDTIFQALGVVRAPGSWINSISYYKYFHYNNCFPKYLAVIHLYISFIYFSIVSNVSLCSFEVKNSSDLINK